MKNVGIQPAMPEIHRQGSREAEGLWEKQPAIVALRYAVMLSALSAGDGVVTRGRRSRTVISNSATTSPEEGRRRGRPSATEVDEADDRNGTQTLNGRKADDRSRRGSKAKPEPRKAPRSVDAHRAAKVFPGGK